MTDTDGRTKIFRDGGRGELCDDGQRFSGMVVGGELCDDGQRFGTDTDGQRFFGMVVVASYVTDGRTKSVTGSLLGARELTFTRTGSGSKS